MSRLIFGYLFYGRINIERGKEKLFLSRKVEHIMIYFLHSCVYKGEALMSYGKSIELFLVNGSADCLITAELSNWNGKAIKIPTIIIF